MLRHRPRSRLLRHDLQGRRGHRELRELNPPRLREGRRGTSDEETFAAVRAATKGDNAMPSCAQLLGIWSEFRRLPASIKQPPLAPGSQQRTAPQCPIGPCRMTTLKG